MNGESKTQRRSHLTLVPPSKEQEWVFGLPAGPRPSPRSVHRLKISLRGARPPIWRRVEVPSTIRFSELHRVIQEAMGWLDLSAHHFVRPWSGRPPRESRGRPPTDPDMPNSGIRLLRSRSRSLTVDRVNDPRLR